MLEKEADSLGGEQESWAIGKKGATCRMIIKNECRLHSVCSKTLSRFDSCSSVIENQQENVKKKCLARISKTSELLHSYIVRTSTN